MEDECVVVLKSGVKYFFRDKAEARTHPLVTVCSGVRHLQSEYSEGPWEKLVSEAIDLPADPDEVIDLVQRERDTTRERKTVMAKADPKPAAAPAAKEEKEKKPILVHGKTLDSILQFGADKEGKPFGPKNNPKREGSASAARFALYKPGKPLSFNIDKDKNPGGPTLDDLRFDSDPKRGYITIT